MRRQPELEALAAGHGSDDRGPADIELDGAARIAEAPCEIALVRLLDGGPGPGLRERALEVLARRGLLLQHAAEALVAGIQRLGLALLLLQWQRRRRRQHAREQG